MHPMNYAYVIETRDRKTVEVTNRLKGKKVRVDTLKNYTIYRSVERLADAFFFHWKAGRTRKTWDSPWERVGTKAEFVEAIESGQTVETLRRYVDGYWRLRRDTIY